MTIAVVTSCSAEGYGKYGLRMLSTLNAHWPRDIPVYLVSEDPLTIPPAISESRRVEFLSISEHADPDVGRFYARHADNKAAHGLGSRSPANFRFNAWKFSKKVIAINLAAERVAASKLIWLDADVVTFARVPVGFLDAIPPRGYALACLDRGKRYHSECGFVSYNLDHAATRPFIAEFQRLYTSDEVFALKEWHDSYVFDWLRARDGIPTYKIPHKSNSHPFVNSFLGSYMDHLKGTLRKDAGQSHDHPRRLKHERALTFTVKRSRLVRRGTR